MEQQEALTPPVLQHEPLLAQDASSRVTVPRMTGRRRIIARVLVENFSTMKPGFLAVSLLGHLHRRSRRRRRRILLAGDEAASEDGSSEGKEGVFHSVVFVVFVTCCLSVPHPLY